MKLKNIFIPMIMIVVFCIGILTIRAMELNKLVKTVNLPKGNTVEIKYVSNEKIDSKTIQLYKDQNENEYLFLDNELIGYFKEVDITSPNSIAKLNSETINDKKENYEAIAFDIAKEIVNKEKTSFADYKLTSNNYVTSYGEFSYTYSKFIDGYITTDSITILLDNNGNLSSFTASRQGIFDKYKDIKIDKEKVNNFIVEEMKKNYSNIENYKVQNQFITFTNEKLTLEIQVELEHTSNEFSLISLYYYL